uniref:Uncharacterized protein n=1 Tax=Glossina austeni TaxID=7395 RepID=A0A1A9V654_GLOAU
MKSKIVFQEGFPQTNFVCRRELLLFVRPRKFRNQKISSENQKEAYGDLIDAKFYSLQEFRLKNVHNCFGEQRQLEILYYQQLRQQRHDLRKQEYINSLNLSSTSDDDNYCISKPYESNVIAIEKQKKNYENFNKTIPYQLKQRQLREEIIKEFKNNKFKLTKSKQRCMEIVQEFVK